MRIQGLITVALPLTAVLLSASLAAVGNYQRVNIETDIQRKFEMSAKLGELTTRMVNAETGMRGYLLTGQPAYLEPYDSAVAELPATFSGLTVLAEAEPGAKPRVEKLQRIEHIRRLTQLQMTDLGVQQGLVTSGPRGPGDPVVRSHLAYGKQTMDQIRAEVQTMQDEERQLLADRIEDVNAIRLRDYLSVVIALVVALGTRFLAWHLFRTGIVRRIDNLVSNLRAQRGGKTMTYPPTGKHDRLGELESEVARTE